MNIVPMFIFINIALADTTQYIKWLAKYSVYELEMVLTLKVPWLFGLSRPMSEIGQNLGQKAGAWHLCIYVGFNF